VNNEREAAGWHIFEGRLKQIYGELLGDGWVFEKGRDEELIGRLQAETGKSESELRRLLAKAREDRAL